MALSITVNGGGTFSASMEEGPVSFTASLGAVPGPKGDTGATGPTGVIAATAPITYDSGTQTVSIDPDPSFTSVTATTFNATNLVFSDGTQTTAFVGEARKEYIIARNNTGSTIAKGKVVYLSGATGNKPTMALAQADAEATSARTIGIVVEETANNGDGKVIISGAAENIDTSAFTAGQTVYLSSSVAGGLQTTLPAAPLHGVVVGIVTRSNPSVGSIEVTIQNYQELSELSDVNVSDKANNDGLFWDSSTTTWRSKTIAEVLGYTPSSLALTSFSASAPISYNSGTGAFTFDSSTFLLKADNLSGLASVSTARTNLGLGSAATSSTSDFAAAVHTHTASAITDFSTAVDALVPAASTTTAGKVELATEAETSAGTSTTLAVTPWGDLFAKLNPSLLTFIATDSTAVTSGGSTFTSALGLGVRTGTASGSYGSRLWEGSSTVGTFPTTGSGTGIAFSRRIFFSGRCQATSSSESANIVQRITFGKRGASPSGSDIGDLAVAGFGIKFSGAGTSVVLMAHNGTTLTSTTSSFTTGTGQVFDWLIYSDGSGNVTLYINGSSVATSTGGPTGNGINVPTAWVEVQATNAVSSPASTALLVSNLRVDLGT